MASRNGKNSSGLRFLWIPGRKKHQHKGRMETTRSQPTYGRPQTRPNEQWSLGGARGQEQLLKTSELAGAGAETTAAVVSTVSVAATATTTAVADALAVAETAEPNPSGGEECAAVDGKEAMKDEVHVEGAASEEGSFADEDGVHNTATLLISDKKSNGATRKKKKDLDAIDRLDDDCVDAAMMNGKGAGGGKNGAVSVAGDGDRRKSEKEIKCDEKTVTCLYYTLQCCECSIS